MSGSQPPRTDLSRYDNSWFSIGASKLKWALWFLANAMFLLNPYNPFGGLKRMVLRMFGAKIGKGVIIKPRVNVKFPWHLEVGDFTWIGEAVWIENHVKVKIGPNCCLSQGAMLVAGNHNYKKPSFDLMVEPITLEEGVWIGANAIVTPGVTCHSHAVLAVNSVASQDLEAYKIYAGNPCQFVRNRNMTAS